MDNYISREDAINCIEHITWYHVNGRGQLVDGANSDTGLYKAKDVYKGLHDIPAAAVAPVVRCGECEYWQDNDGNYGYCYAKDGQGFGHAWGKNDFCSYGERKESAYEI